MKTQNYRLLSLFIKVLIPLMKKQIFFTLTLFLCSTIATSHRTAEAQPDKASSCAAYLVAEAKSGEILDSLEEDVARPPASMAKLMTAYVVLKKIKEGSLNLDDTVTITADASKIGGSQVYLKQGEIFTIKELLNALLVQSANDAALALAQHISGSRDAFVEEMNLEASTLGMTHAKFYSPHGLPPSKDQLPDLLAPKDFLILARSLIYNFPEVLEITKKEVETFRNGSFEMRNHNGLLRTFEGTDGLKTGFYNEAGFCVTTTAQRKGIRLIAVLMGCPSRKARDEAASLLLTRAFGQFKNFSMLKAGENVGMAKVNKGVKSEVALLAKEDISITSRTGSEQQIEKKVSPCQELAAPVSSGSTCGKIDFIRGSEVIASSSLVIAENIAEASLSKRILGMIGW